MLSIFRIKITIKIIIIFLLLIFSNTNDSSAKVSINNTKNKNTKNHKQKIIKKSNSKKSNKNSKNINKIAKPSNQKSNIIYNNEQFNSAIDRSFNIEENKEKYNERNLAIIKQSQYYLLTDYDTGEVIISNNHNEKLPPSSMTKVMTALIVFDLLKKQKISLNNQCLIGVDAWKKRGSSMFLNYGDIVSVEDLLKGLLVASGNDAAIALAESLGSGYDNFIVMMNKKAQEIGLSNSQFKNPHGLNEEGHYMTLQDLSTLMIYIYRNHPEYSHYLGLEDFTFRNITQRNRNPLIKYDYEGVLGGKTGHTDAGGYGVVGAVKRADRILIGVVNRANNPAIRSQLITALFDYGFNNYKKITLFKKNQFIGNVNVWLGRKKSIQVLIDRDISITVPSKTNISDIKITMKYLDPVFANVKKGDKIADLLITINNYKDFTYPLFAAEDVEKVYYARRIVQLVEYKLKKFIRNYKIDIAF
jgi:D-alanyl-D-alanine carboxypeptidase (penicillin-binding protein 5/6)